MLLRFATGCLLAAAMIIANGCCTMHPSACGVGPVGGGCGIEGCNSCPSCGPVGYRHDSFFRHVCSTLTCGSGCGELYWGEWMSDPPDDCDSCDNCGNWTGAAPYGKGTEVTGCGPICWHPLQGLRNLWGYRYASPGYDTGCATCGSASMDYGPMDYGPMDYLPADAPNGEPLEMPSVPKPAPVESSENLEDQQTSNQPARGGQVTHATYSKPR
ncbi:MAG: hypothetical protein JJ992_24115 [Planctomycetes bacterium]|nr:hypothetical protein [Planctomycetota bacterium]